LYGRNPSGGAINILMNSPPLEHTARFRNRVVCG
jgi:hypothetical protein